LWDQFNEVSFEAIEGLYERPIELQRQKMRELRRDSMELFGPKKSLTKQQLEDRMKASREAKKTHQIFKWTRLIIERLTWMIGDLVAAEAERAPRPPGQSSSPLLLKKRRAVPRMGRHCRAIIPIEVVDSTQHICC
jgi:hypothetical protein